MTFRSVVALLIGIGAFAAADVADAGSRRPTLSSLQASLDEGRASLCTLYERVGFSASRPDFCPEPEPVRACEVALDPGPCRGQFARWGFDPAVGACTQFVYGGCGGNANRFETRADCEAACAVDACEQRIDPGPCQAAIPRWAFDADEGTCVEFVWGGCQANGNNYETEAACLESCGGRLEVCELPAKVGPCDATIPRWYHDSSSGRCERFVYGGCDGNANNFESLAECQGACLDTPRCDLPVDPGPCKAAIPRWYHDADTGACERFVYGGCAGNDNNFATQAACERACPLCDDALCGDHQSCQLFRDPRCREQQKRCERICGDGCEQSCDPVPFCADTCDRGACPENTRCELVDVNCVREPCPPVRQCVPIEDELCGDTVCGAFQECRREPLTGARYCADTCADGACKAEEVCTLEPVVCIEEPCPPVRRCAPRDPCAGVQCSPGTRCVVNQIGEPICTVD